MRLDCLVNEEIAIFVFDVHEQKQVMSIAGMRHDLVQ